MFSIIHSLPCRCIVRGLIAAAALKEIKAGLDELRQMTGLSQNAKQIFRAMDEDGSKVAPGAEASPTPPLFVLYGESRTEDTGWHENDRAAAVCSPSARRASTRTSSSSS